MKSLSNWKRLRAASKIGITLISLGCFEAMIAAAQAADAAPEPAGYTPDPDSGIPVNYPERKYDLVFSTPDESNPAVAQQSGLRQVQDTAQNVNNGSSETGTALKLKKKLRH
jgi:hypothetical protein